MPAVTGATRIFAIVGDPIRQVRSPELFNAYFQEVAADAVMLPMQVRAEHLASVLPALQRLDNLHGIVVTIPHKVQAARYAAHLMPTAERVGALNALARRPDGSWHGELFDGQGFLEGLRAAGFDPRGRHQYVVGCGGVGRAIAFALAAAETRSLTLWDIEDGSATSLAARLSVYYPDLEVRIARDAGACDLVVNATPLGMAPDDPLPLDISGLPRNAWVADVVMKPDVTQLLALARVRGHPTLPGAATLEHQIRPMARFFGIPG